MTDNKSNETEMTIRPATAEERLYCGRQSGQIAGQMGWMPGDYQNEDFQKALKTVDTWENGLNVADFCAEHSEAKDKNGTYTFRANVGDYTFMISLFPEASPEHQTDTWCYETRWLDRHMENARDGIRFLDADNGYKTMFRVRDGSEIRRTIRDGAFLDNTDETCRYIDATHMELGDRLYHIDQFAELCRDAWIEVSAVREEDKIPVGRIDVLKPDGKEVEESQRYTNVDDLLRGIEDCDRAGKRCTVVAYRDRHDNLQYREDRPDVRIPLEKYDPERIHFVRERMPEPDVESEETESEEKPWLVGKLDFYGYDGKIAESVSYTDAEKFMKDIRESDDIGRTFAVTLYRDAQGETLPRDFVEDLNPVHVTLHIENAPEEEILSDQEELSSAEAEVTDINEIDDPDYFEQQKIARQEAQEQLADTEREDAADNRKYELLDTQMGVKPYSASHGFPCSRIRALRDIEVPYGVIPKGTLGGYVESEKNLSQSGAAWVYGNAIVCEDALVRDNASVFDDAFVCGNAVVRDNASVYDAAFVGGHAIVGDDASVRDHASLLGHAQMNGFATLNDYAVARGGARIVTANLYAHALAAEHAVVRNGAEIEDEAQISGCATVDGARVTDEAIVCSNAYLERGAVVGGCSYVEDATVHSGAVVMDSRLSQGVVVDASETVVSKITDRGELVPYRHTDASLPFDFPEWKAWETANNQAVQQPRPASVSEPEPTPGREDSPMEYEEEEDELEL